MSQFCLYYVIVRSARRTAASSKRSVSGGQKKHKFNAAVGREFYDRHAKRKQKLSYFVFNDKCCFWHS
jgi:hypothetical protein